MIHPLAQVCCIGVMGHHRIFDRLDVDAVAAKDDRIEVDEVVTNDNSMFEEPLKDMRERLVPRDDDLVLLSEIPIHCKVALVAGSRVVSISQATNLPNRIRSSSAPWPSSGRSSCPASTARCDRLGLAELNDGCPSRTAVPANRRTIRELGGSSA